jgi:hypothetical protein
MIKDVNYLYAKYKGVMSLNEMRERRQWERARLTARIPHTDLPFAWEKSHERTEDEQKAIADAIRERFKDTDKLIWTELKR